MSHYWVKTEYNEEGAYGRVDKKMLYAHINNSCDIVSFYDDKFNYLLSVEDTMENNLLDAINRLFAPHERVDNKYVLDKQVEYMTMDERDKLYRK